MWLLRASSLALLVALTAPAAAQTDADAVHIRGRVDLPPGTPADERVPVTAILDPERIVRPLRAEDLLERRPVAFQSVVAEAGGSFRIAFPPGTKAGNLSVSGRYVYWRRTRVLPGVTEEPVVLTPFLGARIAGTVVLPEGVARERGAIVRLRVRRPGLDGVLRDLVARVLRTSDDLTFAFDALPVYEGYSVSADAGSCAQRHSAAPVRAGETTELELELGLGALVRGVVVDARGAPFEGAHVVAIPSGRETETDEGGAFALDGVEPGDVTLTASVPWARPVDVELGALALGQHVDGVAFTLGAGATVRGVVRWPDGCAVVAAIVDVYGEPAEPMGRRLSLEAHTDAAGRFQVAGVADGRLTLRARAQPTEPKAVRVQQGQWWRARAVAGVAGDDVELTLDPGLVASGCVVDDRGEPVDRFRVSARSIDGKGSLFHDFQDGAFELVGLRPGRWELEVQAGDTLVAQTLECDVPAESAGLAFTLARVARVFGRVVGPDGEPVPRAFVSGGRRADGRGELQVRSEGAATLCLSASSEGYARSESILVPLDAGEERDVVLRLRPEAVIEGVAQSDDGGPIEGRRIVVRAMEGGGGGATADALGRFRVGSLEPGAHVLFLEPREQPIASCGNAYVHVVDRRPSAHVVVSKGETVHVSLGAQKTRLHGVLRLEGEPLTDARIQIRRAVDANPRAFGSVDSEGSYELELEAGEHELLVYSGSQHWSRALRLPAVGAYEHDITLEGGSLAGTVLDELARPAVRERVSVAPASPHTRAWADLWTDANGAWSARALPPGEYVVTAAGSKRGMQMQRATVRDGERTVGVDFRLDLAATVRGRVVDENGTPLMYSAVHVRRADGALLDERSVWTGPGVAFRLEGLAQGAYELVACVSGEVASGSASIHGFPRAERDDVELVVGPAAGLVVRSLDAAGSPVAMLVTLHDESGFDWTLPDRRVPGAPSYDSGRFHARPRSLGPLPAGRYRVGGFALDGRRTEAWVTLSTGSRAQVELRFD